MSWWHIAVVKSIITVDYLEISGEVLMGETEESASAQSQGRAAQHTGAGAAVWPLMLFGFASRQEFCFIRARGPTRVAHPLIVSIIGAIGYELSVSHRSGLTMLSDIGSLSLFLSHKYTHSLATFCL